MSLTAAPTKAAAPATPNPVPASSASTVPAATLPPVDLHNIQGDIFPGLPKKYEAYWFFQIRHGQEKEFRYRLFNLASLITSAAQAIKDQDQIDHLKSARGNDRQLLKLSGVNIAFSHKGLFQLGLSDPIDPSTAATDPFVQGMFNNISALNDQADKWLPEFKKDIHVFVFITGESIATVHERYAELKHILDGTIEEVKFTIGNVRPGKEAGHEHFGYLDGISQPNIAGIDKSPDPKPVEAPIPQGLILLGRDGDEAGRPSWALDGSILAFRYLSQNVPEFQAFIDASNPSNAPQDFLGARLIGRWKSGAPIDVTPLHDDPALGADPVRNNHFSFEDTPTDPKTQDRCPFAAHIRKTNPRNDFPPVVAQTHRILRRGIPFGPEVSPIEKREQKTVLDRGLLFKCYQSQLNNGFQFLQHQWANNPAFPGLNGVTAGFDAIIGQNTNGTVRTTNIGTVTNPNLNLPVEWVISKGGEYFFTPSISALREVIALKPVFDGNGVHGEKNGKGDQHEL